MVGELEIREAQNQLAEAQRIERLVDPAALGPLRNVAQLTKSSVMGVSEVNSFARRLHGGGPRKRDPESRSLRRRHQGRRELTVRRVCPVAHRIDPVAFLDRKRGCQCQSLDMHGPNERLAGLRPRSCHRFRSRAASMGAKKPSRSHP